MERAAKELGGKLEEVQVARSTAEADLAIEKQWRASLQVNQFLSFSSNCCIKHARCTLYIVCCDRWRFKERKIESWSSPMTTRSTDHSKRYMYLYHVDYDTTSTTIFIHFYTQEHAELQEKYAALQETVAEQEIAMVEMGRQLSL
jgi:cytidylate kinase